MSDDHSGFTPTYTLILSYRAEPNAVGSQTSSFSEGSEHFAGVRACTTSPLKAALMKNLGDRQEEAAIKHASRRASRETSSWVRLGAYETTWQLVSKTT